MQKKMKEANTPIFTVVTVVYNAVDTIEKTIQSVLKLKNDAVEYIVVDGNSNDGTLDILEKYRQDISNLIVEDDKGIYDAMNKAVNRSSGQWIININAGDLLMYLPFDEVKNVDVNTCAAVCGSIMMNHKDIRHAKYNWTLKIKNTLPHQAMFYNRSLLFAAYNLKYKVYADYAYNLGIYKRKLNVKLIRNTIANHSTDGISHQKSTSKEFFAVVKNESGYLYLVLSYLYFRSNGLIFRLKKNIWR